MKFSFTKYDRISDESTTQKFLSSRLASTARLANHIFELVSIYGISKTLNRKPAIFIEESNYHLLVSNTRKIMPGLLEKFEIFDRPVFQEATKVLISDKCCVYDDPIQLSNITNRYLHLTGHFYQSWKYFDTHLEEIRNFVKPVTDFSPLPFSDDKNHITCIHIRRTDFVDGQHHSSDGNFVKAALEFIQRREVQNEVEKGKRMLTVLMGDDVQFEEKIFKGTIIARKGIVLENETQFFVSTNSPEDDLAYSRYHCDSALISAPSSTFGWWLGYLSKRQSVFYQDIRSTNDVNYKTGVLDPDDFFPPRWTSIKMDNDRKIVVVD